VSHLSRPQGHLPSQPETNPRGQVNAISAIGEGLKKIPVMVLPEEVPFPHSGGIGGTKREEKPSSTGETSHSLIARPYQPPVPFPQRLAWTKLSQLEPRFARFLDTLRRIYASNPFLNALKEAPAHLKFLRELLTKKGEHAEASLAPIGRSCNALL